MPFNVWNAFGGECLSPEIQGVTIKGMISKFQIKKGPEPVTEK